MKKRFERKPLRPRVTLKDMLQTTWICVSVLAFTVYILYADLSLRTQLANALEQMEEVPAIETPAKEVVVEEVVVEEEVFDLDKLAWAVAMHETKDCTLGNSATRNNCFGIMTWVNWPREYKTYETKEASYADFKRIWSSYYGGMPNYAKAKKYSW